MSDWAQGIVKVKPHLKVGLFVGPANAVEELLRRAVAPEDHVVTLRPPLSPESLGVQTALTGHQVLLVREIESSMESDWELLDHFTSMPKVKGLTILVIGDHLPRVADPEKLIQVRNRAGRQGVFIDVRPPTTELSRRWLVEWFAEECRILVADSQVVCGHVGYSVEDLVWTLKSYRAVSQGRVLPASTARRVLSLVAPQEPVGSAYSLTLHKRSEEALEALRGLPETDCRRYLYLLESALTDLVLLQPVLGMGVSLKTAADKTGLHIVRVLELAEVAPRYPVSSLSRCRQALALGLANVWQPEAARTVALLWR